MHETYIYIYVLKKTMVLGRKFVDMVKQTYDKLNRVYYKAAKDAGMSAPNYIMSTLLTL